MSENENLGQKINGSSIFNITSCSHRDFLCVLDAIKGEDFKY